MARLSRSVVWTVRASSRLGRRGLREEERQEQEEEWPGQSRGGQYDLEPATVAPRQPASAAQVDRFIPQTTRPHRYDDGDGRIVGSGDDALAGWFDQSV